MGVFEILLIIAISLFAMFVVIYTILNKKKGKCCCGDCSKCSCCSSKTNKEH